MWKSVTNVDGVKKGRDMIEHYFSISEIAAQLSLSTRTIRRQIAAGRLEAVRMTDRGDYRVTEGALDEWLRSRKSAA